MKKGDLTTKLFQHKHKFVCRKEIQTRLDEMDLDKVNGKYDWDNPSNNMKYDYVVLDCVCKKCEVAGKVRAFPVSKMMKYFGESHETIETLLTRPMTSFEESITRNSPEFWDRIIEINR